MVGDCCAPALNSTVLGLSAVHIRPTTPSYTPPQLQLPRIRDPRRDYPFENLPVQYGTTPSNSNTSIQRPLARHRVMLSRRVIAYYGLIRVSESLPATYGFAAESAAPKENRLEVGIQRFPSDSRKNLNTYKTKTCAYTVSQRNHYLGTLQTSGHESRNCYYFNELRQIKE